MADDIEELPEATSTIPVEDAPETEPTVEETPLQAEPEAEDHSRIQKLRQAYAEQKRQAAALRQENEILKGQRQQTPDQEVERRARELAAYEVSQREFTSKCNAIYKDGVKEYGKSQFDDAIRLANEAAGGMMPTALIEAMDEAGNAHKLYHYLAENSDVLEDIANLPPHRMGAAVAKLSAKLTAPKGVSKAPPPVKPIGGTTSSDVDIDKLPLDEYMKRMDARDMSRRFG